MAEKKRRGQHEASLVFIGMHNLSEFWWCGMYSALKSKQSELGFFAAYLEDRITYSLLTGRISKIPRKRPELLEIGDDLTLGEIERFNQTQVTAAKRPPSEKKLKRRINGTRKKKNIDLFQRGLEMRRHLPKSMDFAFAGTFVFQITS
jgi:hypothetical protein